MRPTPHTQKILKAKTNSIYTIRLLKSQYLWYSDTITINADALMQELKACNHWKIIKLSEKIKVNEK